jgi:energy-coupling factor transporter ATP-binding protein EcfA2
MNEIWPPPPTDAVRASSEIVAAKPSARDRSRSANELIVAVVGHVGSGTSEIAEALHDLLEHDDLPGGPYEAEISKLGTKSKNGRRAGESLPTSERNDSGDHQIPSGPGR